MYNNIFHDNLSNTTQIAYSKNYSQRFIYWVAYAYVHKCSFKLF